MQLTRDLFAIAKFLLYYHASHSKTTAWTLNLLLTTCSLQSVLYYGRLPVADPGEAGGRRPPPIDLTNFCIHVKSNPRMHQNPPFSGKNSIFFLGMGHPLNRPPHHYEILYPLLTVTTCRPTYIQNNAQSICALSNPLKLISLKTQNFLYYVCLWSRPVAILPSADEDRNREKRMHQCFYGSGFTE